MTNTDVFRVDRPSTTSRVFAFTRWDAVPALAAMFQLAYLIAFSSSTRIRRSG